MIIIIILIVIGVIIAAAALLSGGGKQKAAETPENHDASSDAAKEVLKKTDQKWSEAVYRAGLEKSYGKFNAMRSPATGAESRHIIGDDSVYEIPRLSNKATVFSNPSAKSLLSLKRHLILTAPGGHGKSILMRYLFLTAASSFMRHRSDEIPVPLEAEHLRAIAADNADPSGVIHARMRDLGIDVSREQLDHDLQTGWFLILLDGFDELSGPEADAVAEKLKTFRATRPGVALFAATRPDGAKPLTGFVTLEIMPFSQGEAIRLAKKLTAGQERDADFPRRLRDHFYDDYPKFTENPLLLSMFCAAYLSAEAKPDQPAVFFDAAFDAVTGEKNWRHFRCHENLSRDAFKRAFACFCQQTYFLEQDAFGAAETPSILERALRESNSAGSRDNNIIINPEDILNDLRDRAFVLVRDGNYYRFAHPGFQSAFAALYDIRELPEEQRKSHFRSLISDPSWEKWMEYYAMLYQLEPQRFGSELLKEYIQDLTLRIESGAEDPDIAYLKAMSVMIPWEYDPVRDLVIPRADRGYGLNIRDNAAAALFRKHILGADLSSRRDNFNWQEVDPIFQRLHSLSSYEEVDVQLTPAERRVFYHAAVQSERVPAIREAMRKWLDGLKNQS